MENKLKKVESVVKGMIETCTELAEWHQIDEKIVFSMVDVYNGKIDSLKKILEVIEKKEVVK